MFPVIYQGDGEDEPLTNAQTHQVRIGPKETFRVSDLTDYLSSTSLNTAYAERLEVVQALNILLCHYAKSHPAIATVGGSKSFAINPNTPTRDLGFGLHALRGFFSSIRVAACRILVNVNVSHGAFFDAIPLDRLLMKFAPSVNFNRLKIQSFLKGVRVKVTHLREKKNKAGQTILRAKTICGLANIGDGRRLAHPPRAQTLGPGSKDVSFFLDDSNRYISVHECFEMGSYIPFLQCDKLTTRCIVHNRPIANEKLPVVNVGTRDNPTYFPPEVCVVLPGQSLRTKLNAAQTAEMIQIAVRKPHENAKSIVGDGVNTVGLLPQVNPKLVSCPHSQ